MVDFAVLSSWSDNGKNYSRICSNGEIFIEDDEGIVEEAGMCIECPPQTCDALLYSKENEGDDNLD